jgi:hypothetical protein
MIAGRETQGITVDEGIKSILNDKRESQWILADRMI